MTENKRFKWEDVYKWGVPAFLEVMNGLDKKNQQLKQENKQLKKDRNEIFIRERDTKNELRDIKKENEQLKQTIRDVYGILCVDVDVFSDKATEHDINAYIELRELDNKDAYYIAKGTKKALELLKRGFMDE